jgi:hypothetical protein
MSDVPGIILAVVRGEADLSALNHIGIEITIDETGGERRVILKGTSPTRISPEPVDLAKGLLAHGRNPERLRDWATFVLTASDLIDLQAMDKWPEGDELLSALWDASFAGKLTETELRITKALASGEASRDEDA